MKQAEINEILLSGENLIHFINKYVKVQSPLTGKVSFELYDFQKEFIDSHLNHRFVSTTKSRQLGFTSLLNAITLHRALFFRSQTVLFVVHNHNSIKHSKKIFEYMFNNLPDWIKINRITKNSLNEIEFTNDSRIKFISANDIRCKMHGEKADLTILDELALYPNLNDVHDAVFSRSYPDGKIIICSTTKSIKLTEEKEIFEKIITNDPPNKFCKLQFPWNVHPTRTQEWFENQCRSLNEKEIKSEYEALQVVFDEKENITMLSNETKQKLKKDILTYLGSDILTVELSNEQLDLAIDLGYKSFESKKEIEKDKLFYLSLGHTMIMLAIVRSKFSCIPVPGTEYDMTKNAEELMKMGKKLVGLE